MDQVFRWNAWNRDHATKHGISERESEFIVRRGRPKISAGSKRVQITMEAEPLQGKKRGRSSFRFQQ